MKKVVIVSDYKILVKISNQIYMVSPKECVISELENDEIFYMEYVDGNITKNIFVDFSNKTNNVEFPCSLTKVTKNFFEIKLCNCDSNFNLGKGNFKISDCLSVEYYNRKHGNLVIKNDCKEINLKTLRPIESVDVLCDSEKNVDLVVSFFDGYCFLEYDKENNKIKYLQNFSNIQTKSNEVYMLKNNKDYLGSANVLKLDKKNGRRTEYNVMLENREIEKNLHTIMIYFCQNVLFGNDNYAKSVMTKNLTAVSVDVIREYLGHFSDIIPVNDSVVLLKYRESENNFICKKLIADFVDGKIDNLNIYEL